MSQTLQSQLAAALVSVEIQIKSELDKALEALEAAKARVKAERENEKLVDRKSTRLNSSHIPLSRMPSSA